MFQAQIKTTPDMLGAYTYNFPSREARDDFLGRTDIWWYFRPEEDDGFIRGRAWEIHPDTQAADSVFTRIIPLPEPSNSPPQMQESPPEAGTSEEDPW